MEHDEVDAIVVDEHGNPIPVLIDGAEHVAVAEVPHEEGPIPLLQPAYFDNLIFWALLSLAAIYLIVSRVVQPRISGTLALRQGTITSDLSAAEALRAQAREAESAYEKALADARSESARISAETRAQIQAQLDAELAQADARIEAKTAQSTQALREIEAQAASSAETIARDTARAILEALGAQPDPHAVDAAVARQMTRG